VDMDWDNMIGGDMMLDHIEMDNNIHNRRV
jgi:hypothetical protein